MPNFSDPLLVNILKKAARRLNRKLCLTNTDQEITIDINGDILTPTTGKVSDLEDLVLLQAECIIAQREYQTETRSDENSVLIRDGEQTVDTRASAVARGTFFNSPHSPCAEAEKEINIEKFRRTGGAGKLVW